MQIPGINRILSVFALRKGHIALRQSVPDKWYHGRVASRSVAFLATVLTYKPTEIMQALASSTPLANARLYCRDHIWGFSKMKRHNPDINPVAMSFSI